MLVFEEDMLRLVCRYAPLSGRSFMEFDEELMIWLDMHSADQWLSKWSVLTPCGLIEL